MRDDNSTPRASRTPISASGAGATRPVDEFAETTVVVDDSLVRSEQRSAHRSKRPPPLPNRKAHKIKRIKNQRSTPWAALEPDRLREIASSPRASLLSEAELEESAEARAVGATTLVRHDSQLIDEEREREAERRKFDSISGAAVPAFPAAQPRQDRASISGEAGTDRRWLLLLRVGRDELARIWDGRLESCEPSVWRPATKTWAPLFEVPQIATLVTATVKQRQAKARASVPASPAPRRRQPSGVSHGQAGGRRSSAPPAPQHGPRSETLRPSSMAELGGESHPLAPAARLALRSPYIPPPPRVPSLTGSQARANAALQVQPAFADESSSGPLPSYAAAELYRQSAPDGQIAPYAGEAGYAREATYRSEAPYGAAAPLAQALPTTAAQAFAAAQVSEAAQAFEAVQPSYSEARVIPLTRRTGRDERFSTSQEAYQHFPPGESSFTPAPDSMRAPPPADSYVPHAHTIAPLQSSRAPGMGERAGWLLGGVAAALVLTTFTGLGSSMRAGLSGWLDPKPTLVAQGADTSNESSGSQPTPSKPSSASSQTNEAEKDAPSMVSVDELPVLTKNGAVVPARDQESEPRRHEREPERERTDESEASRGASRSAAKAFVAPPAQATPAPAKPNPEPVRFDAAAARRALASAVGRAQFCAGERANGTIVVTFAPAGSVASVSLANISGSDVRKSCVLNAFRGARITPFHGDPVTVQKSFQLR